MPDEVAKLKTFTRQSSQRTNRRFSLPYCNFLWQGFVFFLSPKSGVTHSHLHRYRLIHNDTTFCVIVPHVHVYVQRGPSFGCCRFSLVPLPLIFLSAPKECILYFRRRDYVLFAERKS